MFINVNAKSIAEKKIGEMTSNWITDSGIYELKLNGIEIVQGNEKSMSANYFSNRVHSYSNTLTSKAGAPTFSMSVLEAVCACADLPGFGDPVPTPIKFKAGEKTLNVLPESIGLTVKLGLQFQYEEYKGEIKEKVIVRGAYRSSDNGTASEILANENIGKAYEKAMNAPQNATYKGTLTKEIVDAWKKKQTSDSKTEAKVTAPATATTSGMQLPE